MLTSEHSIVRYERGQAIPDRLTRVMHRQYLDYADRMLAVYRSGIGRTRRELHRSVANVLAGEPDCDRRRIGSFCKLLDDAGEFESDHKGRAAALRLEVYAKAAEYHPLVTSPDQMFERSEHEAKRLIAAALGRPWADIDAGLYADVLDRQALRSFDGPADATALLSRYNLAQLQACLYKARHMVVHASADLAAIVRHAKLARLLVQVWRSSPRTHRIELSGPASLLHETRRYGTHFARFFAALVACRDWEMTASVLTRWGSTAELRVSSRSGYRSHVVAPAEFDSEVERALAKQWGESRRGWRLLREADILHEGQSTFVPDFLLRHDDGREALLEIVGFWTPEYLQAKRKTIARFSGRRIVLAVAKRVAKSNAAGPSVVHYKTRIDPEMVLEAIEQIAAAPQPQMNAHER